MEDDILHKNDTVKIIGKNIQGTIHSIIGSKATIVVNYIQVIVPLCQLKKIGPLSTKKKSPQHHKYQHSTQLSATIDLHGMYVEEALKYLDQFIDQALLSGYIQLHIIHGKGAGILRNAVRKHLSAHPSKCTICTKYPYNTNAGATIITL